MRRKIFGITLAIIIFTGCLIRLFIGEYLHDEFGEKHFFIKHRPTWKWGFRSPIGQSDLKFENLTPTDQKEQLYFNEFILQRGMSR